ncbi:hypothetical protein Ari01nite_89170 [Paractinoplanes rishiriensis]|uniref:Uncharacterized protein n=1 Tax=Paractinoplanes rishiriensis TaxID=1050105 RepID=A0A919N2R1_9ACTN|nr:hypothetical protein Ari01nite_89170 [Actinoplanes rishiriensis]
MPGDPGGAGGSDQDRLEPGQLRLGPVQQHQGVEQFGTAHRAASTVGGGASGTGDTARTAGARLLNRVCGADDSGNCRGEIAIRWSVEHAFPSRVIVTMTNLLSSFR